MRLGVAIVGCGAIGHKRAQALGDGAYLAACADVDITRAELLAQAFPGAVAFSDWRSVIDLQDVSIVIVSTPNQALAEVSLQAAMAGKHVLVEKPAARFCDELKRVIVASERSNVQVRVGFNHRYHPAFIKARSLFVSGALGEMMFIRGRYGHGGRVGYDREWRANPELSGGGELIDQGVHIIDLARWFLGDFTLVTGSAHTFYWDMPVDDNAFMILKTEEDKTAFLHVSCTEWKNLFSFEIYGRDAKLHIDGLGGSYGIERLAYYKMLPEMGPPETTIWEYPRGDHSWQVEFEVFLEDIKQNRSPAANLTDALAVLEIVEKIYLESGYDHRA